jgi:hypothetical protein
MPDLNDADPQDSSEVFDEDNLDIDEGRSEMRTFEELPDLLDVTQADGDRDEDEALALDADEFDEDAASDNDTEEDHELNYRAATEEREDDLDGQGPEDRLSARNLEGLDKVGDADTVEGGEDDVTDFQATDLSDADLQAMGYAEMRGGAARAKPDR